MHEAFWTGLFDMRWEDAPLGPLRAYGKTKLAAEQTVQQAVAGDGLGGYSGGGGLATKRRLLILEGALAPELPF